VKVHSGHTLILLKIIPVQKTFNDCGLIELWHHTVWLVFMSFGGICCPILQRKWKLLETLEFKIHSENEKRNKYNGLITWRECTDHRY
jgi:hypothetical protein